MKKILFVFVCCVLSFQAVATDDFEHLSGRNTPHWNYIKQEEDKAAFAAFKALYEKNQRYQNVASGEYKIPKVIHFIWLGPNPFPAESVENVRSWIAKHPGWVVKFWTDRERPLPCNGMQKCFVKNFKFSRLANCYKESRNEGEKSDLLRFEILLQQGGIYVDHDASCLKSFDSLHRGYDFYCGLETPHPPFVHRSITTGNGVLGARAGHPVIAKVIDLIVQNWRVLRKKFRGHDPFSSAELVMQRTYIALTHALPETMDREGNIDIVFPSAYFFAKTGITPLYSKHFFADSWSPSKTKRTDLEKHVEKNISKLKQRNRLIQWALFALFLINGCLFLTLWKFRKTSFAITSLSNKQGAG